MASPRKTTDLDSASSIEATDYLMVVRPGESLAADRNKKLLISSLVDTDGTLTANSDTRVPSQKAIKTYADALIATADAMVYKGATDCSTNPNYPAASRGDTYRVSVAGKIGGASGVSVEAGDFYICNTDSTSAGNQATVGANWNVIQTNLAGAYYAGGTDVAVADGGTGASNASGARTNLGLGTAATQNTGTSGGNVPLMNASNNWSSAQSVGASGGATGLNIIYADASIEMGAGRSVDGYAHIDLVGDTTYTDYGLRLIRGATGANATSQLVHRGTGTMSLVAYDAGAISFLTTNTVRLTIGSGGTVTVEGSFLANSSFILNSSTALASLGSATQGSIKFCSDLGGGGGLVAANGSNWSRLSKSGQTTVSSDADFTLTTLTSAEEIRHTGTLTADRTITLSTTNAHNGARFRIARTVSSSLYVLHVGALCDLPALSWCEVIYDGSAWYVAAAGALP